MDLDHIPWTHRMSHVPIRPRTDVGCWSKLILGPILIHLCRPETLRMSELNDSSELQTYSTAVLYNLAAVAPPAEFIEVILGHFTDAIKSSKVKEWFLVLIVELANDRLSLGEYGCTLCLHWLFFSIRIFYPFHSKESGKWWMFYWIAWQMKTLRYERWLQKL